MSGHVDASGLPSELGAVDLLLHRGEANPRTRSGIMALEILDTAPDWELYRSRFENASRKVLRLRQKVVVPTLPTAPARWVVDPDFNLDFHVRRIRVPAPGRLRDVLDLAEVNLQSPTSTIAVCASCPQACATPGSVEEYGAPVRSVIGRASISARRAIRGAYSGPKSQVNPVPPGSALGLRPASTSRSATNWVVANSCRPSSGWRWKWRRHPTRSS